MAIVAAHVLALNHGLIRLKHFVGDVRARTLRPSPPLSLGMLSGCFFVLLSPGVALPPSIVNRYTCEKTRWLQATVGLLLIRFCCACLPPSAEPAPRSHSQRYRVRCVVIAVTKQAKFRCVYSACMGETMPLLYSACEPR